MANIYKVNVAGTTYDIVDATAPRTWYGTSSTTASTTEKAVTCSNYVLKAGAIIGVLFSTANTAATPTLNVNSTGAKTIYIGGNTALSSTANVLKWSANTMVYFMYDGSYYRYITAVAAASVEQPRGANTWYGTANTAASTQAKTSTINNFVLTKGAVASIYFSTANTYTSNKITLNINSTGAKDVYYNGTVTSSTNTCTWPANTVVTFIYDGTGYQVAAMSNYDNKYAAASHTHSDYANQNAFSNITVGSTTVSADTTTDTVTFVGSNITITPDATNDKVTFGLTAANVTTALGFTPAATGHTHDYSQVQIVRW